LSSIEGLPREVDRFVWQKAGRDRYMKLLGVFVTPPSWVVRFTRFKGDVAERAEEYRVYIDGNGRAFRVNHDLPEARSGKRLMEDEARSIAVSALGDASQFKEVSAEASKKPARTDWTFVFKDTRDYGLPEGEPRVSIEVAGDQVADTVRYVYVPEEWSRKERAQRNLPAIFGLLCTILVIAVVAGGAVIGAVHWSRKRAFSTRVFGAVFAILFLLGTVNILNSWPILASQASTTQPLELYVGTIIVTTLVFGLFSAAGLGLVAGLVAASWQRPSTDALAGHRIVLAVSVGLVMAGAGALARHILPSTSPALGNLGPASTFVPFISTALSPLSVFFTQVLTLLIVLYLLNRHPHAAVVWIIAGIAIAGSSGIETVSSWLVLGSITGVLLMLAYVFVFRYRPELMLVTVATLVILSTLRDGFQQTYPSAISGSIIAAVLVALVAGVWFRGSMKMRIE
jgi:hypothetical protein